MNRRGASRLLIVGLLLSACMMVGGLGCGDSDSGNTEPLIIPAQMDAGIDLETGTDVEIGPEGTALTVRLLDPVSLRGLANITLSTGDQSVETDESGRGLVYVQPGSYEIRMERDGTRPHLLFGQAGTTPFEQVSFFSSERITSFVFQSLGLLDDMSKGMIVIGLDMPNLSPAVGASASIDAAHDDPFILTTRAVSGDTVIEGAGGFVTFPNVVPGQVQLETNYPMGECRPFPSEDGDSSVSVEPGAVSIFAFTCR